MRLSAVVVAQVLAFDTPTLCEFFFKKIEELLSLNPNNLHLVIFIIIFNFHTNKKDTAWQSGRVTAVEAQVYPSFLFPLCDLFEKATVIQCERNYKV